MIKKSVEYIRIPKKAFFTLVSILIVASVVWSLLPSAETVDVAVAGIGSFQKKIIDEGITVFKNKHVIAAPADGITPYLELRPGDKVSKDQQLFLFLWDTDYPIRSPISGFITRIFEKDRRHVVRGTPLLEIGDPSTLQIEAKFLTEEAVHLKKGQKVIISQWGGKDSLRGQVSSIEPSAQEYISALGVKEQRVKVLIDFLPTTDLRSLGDGYQVEVQVVINEKPDVLLIPVGALFQREEAAAVFMVNKKKATYQPVEVLDKNREYVAIKSGLKAGDQVILYPGHSISDGVTVKTQKSYEP